VFIIQELLGSVTREKLFMAKGKPQQTGMTAEINSIPTCAIYTNVQYKEEAYLDSIV
jgi:hypothetical protein